MNLIVHQFKTDLRHLRWQLAVLWLLFIAEPVLMCANLPYQSQAVLQSVIFVGELFGALFLITTLVQADRLVGTSAAWLTRPVRRRHLFWAKTAFIVLCLLLPRVAAQGIGWIARGYSFELWLCAAGQSLLFSATFVFVIAVLAALTRDLARFFLAVGITFGLMFAWVVVVEMLKRAHVIEQAGAIWNQRQSFNASVLTAEYLVLAVGCLAAWIAQAALRRRRMGVILFALGLMAFPVIEVCWRLNFLKLRLDPTVPLTLTLWQTNQPASQTPAQFLSTELILSGVPTQHIAAVQEVYANARFFGERKTMHFPAVSFHNYSNRVRPAESPQNGDYFQVIKGFFPPETLWFNDNFRNYPNAAFYDEAVMNLYTNHLPAAAISGRVELDLYAVKKIADVPLRSGTIRTLPGQHASIHSVKLNGGVITVELSESSASLLFDRDLNHKGTDSNYGKSACTYVLYHPRSGEAFLARPDNAQTAFPDVLSGEARLFWKLCFPYSALRERFAGVTAAEWMSEARIWIFAPVYEGTANYNFADDHYTWPALRGSSYQEAGNLAGDAALERATLPTNPSEAQINAYVDEILLNVPDLLPSEKSQDIGKKLAAIGSNGLPALLRRLPLTGKVEHPIVLPTIIKLATRDQLSELRAALQRDPEVIRVFTEKKWEADARDVLMGMLPDHRQPLSAEELRIAAEAKNAATYPDLRWHFVNLNHGHDRVLPALEQCPGFDTAEAVREAWKRAQLGVISTSDLALPAAKQGLPEALALAVIRLERTGGQNQNQGELSQLTTLTGYNGPSTNALAWVSAHLEQFRFNAAQQRYELLTER